MIVLSIIKVIQCIKIKFAVLLVADEEFKVIIKKYDEKINYDDLIERIYETSILRRFKNNLAKSVKTAVDHVKCKERENHIFLIFTDS